MLALLQTMSLNKKFGGHQALHNVDVTFEAGEVHALVGENGAGKSTFIKILTGVYYPTSGDILLNGEAVEIENPKVAQELGINVIHQDRQLIPYFTGLENLFLNRTYPKTKLGAVNWKKMRKEAETLQNKWQIAVPLHLPVYAMTPTQRTMLEILRAMGQESKMLILDEPTASLTDKEAEVLFALIQKLVDEGVSIVYISHRLEEVTKLAKKVTVLTGGKVTASLEGEEISTDRIIHYMTNGQKMKEVKRSGPIQDTNATLLSVSGLASKDQKVKDVSFTVRAGEIVGMYGLAGAGRTESMEILFGLRQQEAGEIFYKKEKIAKPTPGKMIDHGLILIPENRHDDGLIMSNTIKENMTITTLDQVSKVGVIQNKKEWTKVNEQMNRFKVKAVHMNQPISELSGGNQQKVVFGKSLLTNPDLYICDEPTQAVDVMTRNEIHHFLQQQAKQNKGIIFISSDLHEVLEISDRIIVFSEGKTVADITNDDTIDTHAVLEICYQHQRKDG